MLLNYFFLYHCYYFLLNVAVVIDFQLLMLCFFSMILVL